MTKLCCILAWQADTGVIFRRGPGKLIRLIGWNLKTHSFEPGQWFKGQIYVRKSDLSPDGTKLVYYAAKFRAPLLTWIAISSPPFLTAVVLWEASGTWNDLSLFETNTVLALATYRADSTIDPYAGFAVPHQLTVKPKPWPGCFHKLADHDRLIRDGWVVHSGDPVYRARLAKHAEPVVYRKCGIARFQPAYLDMSAVDDATVSYSFCEAPGGAAELNADWAEMRGNDLLFSRGGKLFCRTSRKVAKRLVYDGPREIADFGDMTFEPVEAPGWAKTW